MQTYQYLKKIDLLSKLQYGKSRSRIEAGGQEIFMDEGGFKSRDIGLGFNKEAMLEGSDKEGLGGILMYNLETGEPEFSFGYKKKFNFADGGRANFDKGGMSRRQFMKIMGGIASLPFIGATDFIASEPGRESIFFEPESTSVHPS